MLLDLLQKTSHCVVREVELQTEVLDNKLRIFSFIDLENFSAVPIKLDTEGANWLVSLQILYQWPSSLDIMILSQESHVSELVTDLGTLLVGQRESLSVDQVLDYRNLSAQVFFGLVRLVVYDLMEILG